MKNENADIFSEEFECSPRLSAEFVQRLTANFTEKTSIPAVDLNDEVCAEDVEFDKILPPLHRFLSPVQWTSIKVARVIAQWLAPYQNKKFLDAGSGVGKLCILLRYLTSLEIHGIEQRENLVRVSQEIVTANNLERIFFSSGNIQDICFNDYDIFYLYNPFQEHVCYSETLLIDNKIELNKKYFHDYTAKILAELKSAKIGSVLITFHGYGGSVPKSWRLKINQFVEGGFLSMWIKEK